MFEKTLKKEMLEAEINRLQIQLEKQQILADKELVIWRKKIDEEKLKNDMLEYAKEDERG